jgi:hypothetical protein
MMTRTAHSIASDHISWQGFGARVPKGTIHAVLNGVKSTGCGLSLDGLHKFPDVEFDASTMFDGTPCEGCLGWLRGASPSRY